LCNVKNTRKVQFATLIDTLRKTQRESQPIASLEKPQASPYALLRLIVPIQAKPAYRSFPLSGGDRLKPADRPHESLKNFFSHFLTLFRQARPIWLLRVLCQDSSGTIDLPPLASRRHSILNITQSP
jgi:hypothetical protein